jgi:nitrogen fixation protein NifB
MALIAPGDAVHYVEKAMALCRSLTVVGVAGPGEAFATGHALAALGAVHERYPKLIKCVSTNGLRLPERVGEALAAGVTTLSVTVNAIDTDVLARMNDGVVTGGEYRSDRNAGQTLIDNQLAGISLASAAGVKVKVNAVYAPDINGAHIPEIAEAVAARGACVFNVIPLIARYKLRDERAPSCAETEALRGKVEKYLPVFRRCRRCRADAAGTIGGPDYAPRLYGRGYGRERQAENTFSHG